MSKSPSEPEKDGLQFRLSKRTQSLMGVQILSCGSYVPERVVTNKELEDGYGFEEGWIKKRTGILERRYAAPEESTKDLCIQAAKDVMERAKVTADEIDLVLVGTFSPDYACPSTACLVQAELGLDAPAVDLQAACSGFMYALVTGAQYVATGNSKMALVIGADVNSRIVNPTDQRTAPLFGDGAGAVLMTQGTPEQGLLCYQLGSDGRGGNLLERPAGGTKCALTPENLTAGDYFLQMDGRSVFKWAVQAVKQTIQLMLDKTELSVEEITHYMLHQANIRIINAAIKDLDIPPDRMLNNLHQYGNTSAGSIPIVLADALKNELVSPGDTLLFSGFGGGLTWGTGVFRW